MTNNDDVIVYIETNKGHGVEQLNLSELAEEMLKENGIDDYGYLVNEALWCQATLEKFLSKIREAME